MTDTTIKKAKAIDIPIITIRDILHKLAQFVSLYLILNFVFLLSFPEWRVLLSDGAMSITLFFPVILNIFLFGILYFLAPVLVEAKTELVEVEPDTTE